jgi:hypothetical protein
MKAPLRTITAAIIKSNTSRIRIRINLLKFTKWVMAILTTNGPKINTIPLLITTNLRDALESGVGFAGPALVPRTETAIPQVERGIRSPNHHRAAFSLAQSSEQWPSSAVKRGSTSLETVSQSNCTLT